MLVGQENGVQFLDLNAFLLEEKMKFLAGQSGIDQDRALAGPQDGCVSRTARSQNLKVNLHLQGVKENARRLANPKLKKSIHVREALELFDVVDRSDRVIGQTSRERVHKGNLLHRAVHVLVQSRPDRWLLQMRSDRKDLDPSLWTSSCSGHVDSGEGYRDCATRECMEELGLEAPPRKLREVFRCSPCSETGNEFVRVYLFRSTGKASPNPAEICDLKELGLDEIEFELASDPKGYSQSFRHLFPFVRKAMGRYMSSS